VALGQQAANILKRDWPSEAFFRFILIICCARHMASSNVGVRGYQVIEAMRPSLRNTKHAA
jgi:hypothetical protein